MIEKDENEMSPLGDIIKRVDSYIKDPKLVTPDTLSELKSELEDLKGFLDSDGNEDGEESHKVNSTAGPGIMIMLGKVKSGGKYNE